VTSRSRDVLTVKSRDSAASMDLTWHLYHHVQGMRRVGDMCTAQSAYVNRNIIVLIDWADNWV